jgi:hypothetical protein
VRKNVMGEVEDILFIRGEGRKKEHHFIRKFPDFIPNSDYI